MPAKGAWTTDKVRARIQTAMLINRLQKFATGADGIVMTDAQVRAALGLLKKSLPDLQAVQLSGPGGGPVMIQRIERVIVKPDGKEIEIMAPDEPEPKRSIYGPRL